MGKKFDALEHTVNNTVETLINLLDELKAGRVINRGVIKGLFPRKAAISLLALKEAVGEESSRLDAVLDHLNIRLEKVERGEAWVVVTKAPATKNPTGR